MGDKFDRRSMKGKPLVDSHHFDKREERESHARDDDFGYSNNESKLSDDRYSRFDRDSRSPHRGGFSRNSPSYRRNDSRSPIDRRGRDRDSQNPKRFSSRSPVRSRSPPARYRSRSPTGYRNRSPRSRSPIIHRSRSPRYQSRSPIRYRSRSPIGYKSRSPRRQSPGRYRSRSPVNYSDRYRSRSRSYSPIDRSRYRRHDSPSDRHRRDHSSDPYEERNRREERRRREEANDKRWKEARQVQDEYRKKYHEEKKNALFDAKDMPPLYSIWKGTVKSIKEFGLFIDIQGFRKQGFVHISQISDYKIHGSQVNDVVSSDEEVFVKVISVDEELGKYSLSIKYVNQSTGEDLDRNLLKLMREKDRNKQVHHFEEKMPNKRDEYVDMMCSRCGTYGHLAAECVVNLNEAQKRYDLVSVDAFIDKTSSEKKRKKKDMKEKKKSKKDKKRRKMDE